MGEEGLSKPTDALAFGVPTITKPSPAFNNLSARWYQSKANWGSSYRSRGQLVYLASDVIKLYLSAKSSLHLKNRFSMRPESLAERPSSAP